ncbi:MAG TPA: rhomboid family intramembrane serine protease [Anaerolineaceae bacterium]
MNSPESPYQQTPVQPPSPVLVRLPERKPVIVYLILFGTILVYILQWWSEGLYGEDIPLLLGAKIPAAIAGGQYWRLFTPALLHVSVMHIAFNMYALFTIGRGLERFYGHLPFLILYGIGALGGNVLSYLLSDSISVGASTAVFGLVAAQGVFIYQNRSLFGANARSMIGNILLIVVINLGIGLSGGIDNWGHLGGLVSGFAFAMAAGPVLEIQQDAQGLFISNQRSSFHAFAFGGGLAFLLFLLVFTRSWK